MNAQCNAPISDRFSSLCARVFYRRSAILKNRRGEEPGDEVAMRPSLQYGFQNGGRSNCSVTELFAVTIRLKGKFTS